MSIESTFLSELAFFGLTSDTAAQYRVNLFTQIHEIVFHGKGGYDWETIYNMPRWLRHFTFNKISDHYRKEADEREKSYAKSSNKSTLIDPSGNVNKQAFKEASPKVTSGPSPKPKVKYK